MERPNAQGKITRTLRFNVNGKRRAVALGVVTRADAEQRLAHELADVQRGQWRPATPERSPQADTPTFHEYAEQWWLAKAPQLADGTRADYQRRLEKHLLGYFGSMPLDAIQPQNVREYVAGKLKPRGPLAPRSVNMTVTLLAAILEQAREDELIDGNPAKGKGRRVKERKARGSYLDTAEQIASLLTAAGELDAKAPAGRKHVRRRAMLATLAFAGLRISELLTLRWRDVDLAGGWLHVHGTKTDSADRRVKIRGALRDELLAVRTQVEPAPDGYVFATATGARLGPDNFRNRVLAGAVRRADETRAAAGLPPLPRITPQSLRRTFSSVLYGLGEGPPVVMAEMGHTDPGLALRVYAQAMRMDDSQRGKLTALVEGEFRHGKGTSEPSTEPELAVRRAA